MPSSPKKVNATILWGFAAGILLIAFFLRFHKIGTHPLGIFFDPAINGLDAVRLMQRGGHVLFFPTNGGRESLFMYLLIPFIQLFGTTPFAIRALTATISLLTVALLFGFLYDFRFSIFDYSPVDLRLFGSAQKTRSQITTFGNSQFTISLPLFAGLILATMYWHIAVSRLGQRPILVPMLAVPIFWFFLKGWGNGQKRWFIFSGMLMGLAGYTYSAARLLPVILVLALLPEIFVGSRESGVRGQEKNKRNTHHVTRIRRFKLLLIFAAAAFTVYIPMAWYLLAHPAQFAARAGSVMVWNFLNTPAEIAAELGRNALRVAGFFCCAGSPNPIFGLPGYPGLSWLLAPFLLIGLVIAAKSWRSLFYRLIALWWIIGIAPSIIAIESPHPLRMIVAIPPTAILVALGLIRLQLTIRHSSLVTRHSSFVIRHSSLAIRHSPFVTRHSSLAIRHSSFVIPVLLILLPLPFVYRAYFVSWTDLQSTRGAYDYGAVAIRDAVLEQTESGVPIYLPLYRFNDSTLLYYLSGPFQREAGLTASPQETALVISPDKTAGDSTWVRLHNGAATVLPPLDSRGRQLIQTALAGNQSTPIRTVDGKTAAKMAALPDDPVPFAQEMTDLFDVSFGPLQLIGATYPQVIDPAKEHPVTLFWQASSQMSDEFEILVRLVDDSRRSWANGDARPTDWVYPTSFWQPGVDQVAAQHTLLQESQPPPGRYRLAVSVFDAAKGQRLPLTGGTGDSPDTFFAGPLKVPLPTPNSAQIQQITPYSATFGEIAQLQGFRIEPASPAPGDTINLHLLWQAIDTLPLDYTVFVHLLDAENNLITGSDSQPVAGTYPTVIWATGEQIMDNHLLSIPPNLAAGQYHLAIGLYHQPTGQRLPINLSEGTTSPDGRLILPQKLVW